jgi:Cu-processing system permease protein
LAGKEVRDARRNRWFLMLMGIFVALSLLLTLFGLAGVGQSGALGFVRTFASLLSLSLLIVFTIKGLPPGKYTLEFVHEKLGTKTVEVEAKANAVAQAEVVFKL